VHSQISRILCPPRPPPQNQANYGKFTIDHARRQLAELEEEELEENKEARRARYACVLMGGFLLAINFGFF
jgi:hypothetical protein